MSILLDEQQRAIGEAARRLVADRFGDERGRRALLAQVESVGVQDESFWQEIAAAGWPGVTVPDAQGGLGLGLVELGELAQALGREAAGTPYLAAGAALARVLEEAGGQPALLAGIAAGAARAVIAFAEGTEPFPLLPQCRWTESGTLSGVKPGVAGALAATHALVWAADPDGPVLALADLGPGASVQAISGYDNGRLHGHIAFADAPAHLLARGDAAHALARSALMVQALALANEALGGAEALLVIARDYALARKAFGQPIGAFQSVKHRIAELYGLIEIARANCLDAAARHGSPGFSTAVASARLSAGEAYDTAARDCVQIHGGIGVTWEAGLHLHMRRARSLAVEAGHGPFWEDWLVDELVAEGAGA